MARPFLRIAVPSPLRRLFDYLMPADCPVTPVPGQRVRVPFGRGQAIGILVDLPQSSPVPESRLRQAIEILDAEPLLPPDMLRLLSWAGDYYHHPAGEVFSAGLPAMLRQGKPASTRGTVRWRSTDQGIDASRDGAMKGKAPRQQALLVRLAASPEGLTGEMLNLEFANWRTVMARLVEKGWAVKEESSNLHIPCGADTASAPVLSAAQREAVAAVEGALGRFQPFLLDGVTGSGKTEVYLQVIDSVLRAGRQVLVLVPEIGLTPQLVARFSKRLAAPMVMLHSGLADGERLQAWLHARAGRAGIVLGTRSAIFTPMSDLGLIIVDEEHDGSFKQQEGFRYSARDLAVMRAHNGDIPVVLGSATPSLESLYNVRQGRYQRLVLAERAGAAAPPRLCLLDVRNRRLEDGLSDPLLDAMRLHLGRGGQVLLFLNRRGYSPTVLCHGCGWVSQCRRCDAHMTLYQSQGRLICHHCGAEQRVPVQCPDCHTPELRPVGQGTERIEQAVARHFPDIPMVRVDRDSTRRKGAMQALLSDARSGSTRILIGTQMLAKGHHFPGVTLVGILDADQGLFSADFRASERMAQLILQVAGRAGRADRPGEVLIQTHQPDHPLLRLLVDKDYQCFAAAALEERRLAEFPPYSHLALLRAEAVNAAAPMVFLTQARTLAEEYGVAGLSIWGPVPAPMERRAGRTRAQLVLQAAHRSDLHRLLRDWAPRLEDIKAGRKVRWSLDVDPVEMF